MINQANNKKFMQEYVSGHINDLKLKDYAKRIITVFSIAAFQTFCYYYVNRVCGTFNPDNLLNLNSFIDDAIPYYGWTWMFYYSADIYMTAWALVISLKMLDTVFIKTVLLYIIMIITGALLQILLPAQSPYPDKLIPVQSWFHVTVIDAPYACLPSMHIALSVFPCLIGIKVIKSKTINTFSVILVILISISTMTMKEHYFFDVLTGLLLGIIFYAIWNHSQKNRQSTGDINFTKY